MPQRGTTEVPGYGHVKALAGLPASGRYRLGRLIIDFGDEAGCELVREAVSEMTLVKIREITGDASATRIVIAIDTRGQKRPQAFASATLDDIVVKISKLGRAKRSLRDDAPPVRTAVPRGGLHPSMR